jgi:tripartite ATP-independent transporter DctP family solute receptor
MKLKALLLTGLAAGAALLAPAQAEEIRYSLWAQPGEAQYQGALEFKRVVEEGSNGRHTVTVFGGNQLGEPREVFAQMALGSTQIQASGDPGMNEIEYLSLPYLMKGIENLKAVLATDFARDWDERLVKERQVRMLGFMPRSPRQISADRVVNSLEDLRGLKIRSPERDYYMQSLAALGTNPTPMSFAEVYTSLQTGIVDGQENPLETIYAQKFYEVQKGIAMVDYIKKPAYVVVSESFWQGLSEEDRELLRRANDASTAVVEKLMPEQAKAQIAEMEAAGVTITYPDQAPFEAATQAVRDSLGKKIWGEDVYRQIVEIGQKDF